MRLSLIVAVARNGVIGRDNELPWRLSADLRHFKRLTTGHPIVMGRRTWESIGRPLPGRRNVVLSRDPAFAAEGVEVFRGLEQALEALQGAEEVFVIGGAAIYAMALPRADRVYLTRVEAEVEGDTRFPDLDPAHWRRVAREEHRADERNELPYSFEIWEPRGKTLSAAADR